MSTLFDGEVAVLQITTTLILRIPGRNGVTQTIELDNRPPAITNGRKALPAKKQAPPSKAVSNGESTNVDQDAAPADFLCACGQPFKTARGLSVHRGKAHKSAGSENSNTPNDTAAVQTNGSKPKTALPRAEGWQERAITAANAGFLDPDVK